MRKELQTISLIQEYLNGQLSDAGKKAFENELAGNPELSAQLQIQKELAVAVRRAALRKEIANAGGSPGFGGKFLAIAAPVIAIAICIGGYAFYRNSSSENERITTEKNVIETHTELENIIPFQSENLVKIGNLPGISSNTQTSVNTGFVAEEDLFNSGKEDVQPWIPFKRQYYSFNAAQGSTIEGRSGTLVIVPENGFVDKTGKIVNGEITLELIEALELSDMIAYNLTTMSNGKMLSSGGMIRIEARKGQEEIFVNPQKPLYIEIPAENYNPEMMAWKGNIKNGELNWEDPQKLKSFLTIVDFANLDFLPEGFANEVQRLMPFGNRKIADKNFVDSLYYTLGNSTQNLGSIGETNKKVGVKHDGVKLSQITEGKMGRVDIKDSKSGSKIQGVEASCESEDGSVLNLISDSWGAIFLPKGEYKITFKIEGKQDAVYKKYKVESPAQDVYLTLIDSEKEDACFIHPLSVKTLKTSEFSKTFIATKEFEERLRLLHKEREGAALLKVYLNNINKDLWYSDSCVATALKGPRKKTFESFSRQRLGNVKDAPEYAEKLSDYYNLKREEFTEQRDKLHRVYLQKSAEELKNNESQNWDASAAILPQSLVVPSVASTPKAYATPWYSTGWMNIDCYLHLLEKGEPVAVTITSDKKNARIFQCLNTMNTIVPLNGSADLGYTAKFPDRKLAEAKLMTGTFCYGIAKNANGEIFFAEQRYNPYETEQVNLSWNSVTQDELKVRLLALSPINERSMKFMKQEEETLERIRKFQASAGRTVHVVSKTKEQSIMEQLTDFINNCKTVPKNYPTGLPIENNAKSISPAQLEK